MTRTFRVLTLVASLVCVRSASAQSAGGHIIGVITDEQGAPVPDVFVTAHGSDQSQVFKTSANGEYRLHDLTAGRYVLTAARDGYTTVVRNGVMVHVKKTASLPLVLKGAGSSDEQVQAPAPIRTARFRGLTEGSTFDGTLPSYNPIESLPPASVVFVDQRVAQIRR
jgi:hypothetical protein